MRPGSKPKKVAGCEPKTFFNEGCRARSVATPACHASSFLLDDTVFVITSECHQSRIIGHLRVIQAFPGLGSFFLPWADLQPATC
jgi:hypothetical protein